MLCWWKSVPAELTSTGILMSSFHGLMFYVWLIMVKSCLVISDYLIQKTATLSFVLGRKFLTTIFSGGFGVPLWVIAGHTLRTIFCNSVYSALLLTHCRQCSVPYAVTQHRIPPPPWTYSREELIDSAPSFVVWQLCVDDSNVVCHSHHYHHSWNALHIVDTL